MNVPIDSFRDAIRAAGMIPPDSIEPGRVHRFPGVGKANGNSAGWCKLFPDGMGGCFGDWSTGLSENWQARREGPVSPTELETFRERVTRAQAECEAERQRMQADAASMAAERWQQAQSAPEDHPYLRRKGIKPNGARVQGGTLLVPLRDEAGALCNVQRISPDGAKLFQPRARVTGYYYSIGKPTGAIYVAEGFATGASVHEATGEAVAVAFNAGNLEAVARVIRSKYPRARLVLCADDDYRTEGNPGLTKATEAALAVNGLVAIPDFGPNRPEGATDFNDLRDPNAIKRAIANAKPPEAATPQPETPNAIAADSSRPHVRLIRGDTIELRPVAWLWSGYIALGKMHIVAGAPGTGKTTLTLGLAATITQGGRWPDGSRAPVGDVLIWSGEDAAGDTLAPRLRASGADLARVQFVGDVQEGREPVPFDPSKHFAALAHAAAALPNLRMMIVDPIVSAVAGDSHQNAEVRRALAPLVTFAEKADCALIGISHFTKGTQGRDPLERVTGSLGFGAVARVVFGTAKLPEEDGGGRVLVRLKSNLGPDGGGFKYELRQVDLTGAHEGISTTRVEWGEPIEGSARDILASAEQADESGGGESPKDFLRDLLSGGPMRAADVFKDADSNGLSRSQMHRAKASLGVVAEKLGMKLGWEWSLPKMTVGPEDVEDTGHKNPAPSQPSAASSGEIYAGEVF